MIVFTLIFLAVLLTFAIPLTILVKKSPQREYPPGTFMDTYQDYDFLNLDADANYHAFISNMNWLPAPSRRFADPRVPSHDFGPPAWWFDLWVNAAVDMFGADHVKRKLDDFTAQKGLAMPPGYWPPLGKQLAKK